MPKATAMKQLTFEVPMAEQPETFFLTKALEHVQILHVLEFRSEGFALVCRGSRQESKRFRESLSIDDSHHVRVTVLNREKSGSEILLVSGKWLLSSHNGKFDRRQAKKLEFFKTMERAPSSGEGYVLGNPSFEGGKLRISVMASENMIEQLLKGMDRVRVRYRVLKLGRPRASSNSTLNSLTARQVRMLRFAHTMGYYDVPRRASTEDLARLLRMGKGTVGEHLRRAEKHVFDRLLS